MQRKPLINDKNLNAFIMGAPDERTMASEQYSKSEPILREDLNRLRRQTYYITNHYILAIKQMSFYENMDKSEIVRKALEQYIPAKYADLAENSCKCK